MISQCLNLDDCSLTHMSVAMPQTLQWRHNERDGVSNHQPHDCLLSRLFRHRWKKISKLCVTALSAGNSPVTSEFPAQRASNAENVSIWWRHHGATPWCWSDIWQMLISNTQQYVLGTKYTNSMHHYASGNWIVINLLGNGLLPIRCHSNAEIIVDLTLQFEWNSGQ